ncbi:MAG: hypothetical protein IPI57_14990 [Candidatus Competibacteraceae bacterium]|nr:hypothetical protein [Candidatus Competibacteraceae bacterium]
MTLMTEEEQELFDKLPSDGSYVTNPDLLRRLGNGWDSNRYWNIRNILVDRGVLAVARGRGGLIHRVVEESVVSEPFIEQSDIIQEHQILEREEDLYNPIRTVPR